MQFGMPTLIENKTLEDNVNLCKSLGLKFIELNMNFPEYQVEKIEETERLLSLAKEAEQYSIAARKGSDMHIKELVKTLEEKREDA